MEDSAPRFQENAKSWPVENSSKQPFDSSMTHRLIEDDLFVEESRIMNEIYHQEESGNATIRKKKRDLYCFHCNRLESHLPYKVGWYHGLLTGLSLGLNHWLGPFYCRCCGYRRLMFADWANPRYWLTMRRLQRQFAPSKRKKRSLKRH